MVRFTASFAQNRIKSTTMNKNKSKLLSPHADFSLEIPWKSAPFLRIAPALVAGIVVGLYYNYDIWATKIVLLLCAVAYCALLGVKPNVAKYTHVILLNLCCFLLGFEFLVAHTPLHSPSFFASKLGSSSALLVQIVEPPQKKARSYKLLVKVKNSSDTSFNTQKATGKLLINLKICEAAQNLEYGDFLQISAQSIVPVKPTNNEYTFDYRDYLAKKGVYHQAYLDSLSWKKIGGVSAKNPFKIAYNLQKKFVAAMATYLKNPDYVGLLSALVIGYRSDLSPEITQAYSDTGTIHVLSVSGLHVGIIYFLLQGIFDFIFRKNTSKSRITKAFGVILGLFAFTFVTGLVPCVCRASFMFALVVAGKASSKNISMYNSLAATFFILLLINPYYLVDVGFQLSYLAVLGIVFLHKKMYNLMYIENTFLRKIWNLTCVSFTAQTATLPLTIYYFHQFPNHFWFANLLVIPLASLLLLLGIVLMLVSWWSVVATPVAWLTNLCLMFNDWLIHTLQGLPYAVTQGLFITKYQIYLWFLVLIGLILAAIYKYKTWLWASLLGVFLLSITQFIELKNAWKQQSLLVSNATKLSITTVICGEKAIFWVNDSLPKLENLQFLGLKNYLNAHHITSYKYENWANHQYTAVINGKRILNLTRKNKRWQYAKQAMATDILLVSGNVWLDTARIKAVFAPKLVVFDGSNAQGYCKKNQALLNKAAIPSFFVGNGGDYQLIDQ